MKTLRTEFLIKKGNFVDSPAYELIFSTIYKAIDSVKWPDGADTFTIFPGKNANGVKPIKERCVSYLKNRDWELEKKMDLGSRISPGPVDAVLSVEQYGDFAFEWETGNISSSHRALNKMALGLITKSLIGGVLVVPSRDLYFHLTDRIGNFAEIEPYFPIWKSLPVEGVLAVIEVEYDSISESVPQIYKGTDGRALV
jgi:Restriction endonuclease BamHI